MAAERKVGVKSNAVEEIDGAVKEPEAGQAGGGQERNHQGSTHWESVRGPGGPVVHWRVARSGPDVNRREFFRLTHSISVVNNFT